MRLIDADALIDKKCSTCCLRKTCANRYEKDGKQYVCGDIKDIVNAPTIEAEPIKNGRWVYRRGEDWCHCSVCGTYAKGSDGECFETPRCPYCGAYLRGSAENET